MPIQDTDSGCQGAWGPRAAGDCRGVPGRCSAAAQCRSQGYVVATQGAACTDDDYHPAASEALHQLMLVLALFVYIATSRDSHACATLMAALSLSTECC